MEINPEHSLEGLMLKLKLQYFGHLIRRADSLEKTLMLGKIEGRRKTGLQKTPKKKKKKKGKNKILAKRPKYMQKKTLFIMFL